MLRGLDVVLDAAAGDYPDPEALGVMLGSLRSNMLSAGFDFSAPLRSFELRWKTPEPAGRRYWSLIVSDGPMPPPSFPSGAFDVTCVPSKMHESLV